MNVVRVFVIAASLSLIGCTADVRRDEAVQARADAPRCEADAPGVFPAPRPGSRARLQKSARLTQGKRSGIHGRCGRKATEIAVQLQASKVKRSFEFQAMLALCAADPHPGQK